MSLQVKNTRDLVKPGSLKLKILIYGLPGTGKTLWASGAPNAGFAACETGTGKGLLTAAGVGLDYVEPSSFADFDAFCGGAVFKEKETLVIDSLSDMAKTFIKDAALAMPRSRGDSEKRKKGIPELDDYGVMGELTRRLLRKLIDQDKHVIVTATERYDKPDPENGQGEMLIGPDLPGQMFLGSTAMFDLVLRLRTRPALRDPKDAKTRFTQRYFVTQPDGTGAIAKCRLNGLNGTALLDKEEVFDPVTGQGTFQFLLEKVLRGYAQIVGEDSMTVVAS